MYSTNYADNVALNRTGMSKCSRKTSDKKQQQQRTKQQQQQQIPTKASCLFNPSENIKLNYDVVCESYT